MKRTRYSTSDQSAELAVSYVFWKDPAFFGCVITGLLLTVVLVKLLSPEHGILKVQKVKRIKAQLEDDITLLKQANAQLVADINTMQTDPFRQEKIAREELNMALPGEIVYKFVPSRRWAESL